MNSTLELPGKMATRRAARKWMLIGLLVVLLSGIFWISNYSSAEAAEPDLALLKAAYAGSEVNSQMQTARSPIVIPAAAFRVDSSNREWFFGFNSAYLYPTGSSAYCGIAPLYLPDGAEVTGFAAYLYDNDAIQSATAYLFAKPFASLASATMMASVQTTAQSADVQTLSAASILSAPIDNSRNTYHIGVCLWGADSNMRLYAVKVEYQYKNYIPAVSR